MADDIHKADPALEEFLAASAEDWFKAGQPGIPVTIAMVREIGRLRAELARITEPRGSMSARVGELIQQLHAEAVASGAIAARLEGMPDD